MKFIDLLTGRKDKKVVIEPNQAVHDVKNMYMKDLLNIKKSARSIQKSADDITRYIAKVTGEEKAK